MTRVLYGKVNSRAALRVNGRSGESVSMKRQRHRLNTETHVLEVNEKQRPVSAKGEEEKKH